MESTYTVKYRAGSLSPPQMGEEMQVVPSDQCFPLKLTTHRVLPHFTSNNTIHPHHQPCEGKFKKRAELTNQEIALESFFQLKKKKIIGCLLASACPRGVLKALPPTSQHSQCVLLLPRPLFEMVPIFSKL